MGTAVYSFKFESNAGLFPIWSGDHWLGKRVEFKICDTRFTGTVIATHREYLCNSIHEILTVEVENEHKQVKVEMHRQAFKIISEDNAKERR